MVRNDFTTMTTAGGNWMSEKLDKHIRSLITSICPSDLDRGSNRK